jgi:hypothetical protein
VGERGREVVMMRVTMRGDKGGERGKGAVVP